MATGLQWKFGYTPGVVAMPKYGQIPNYMEWCIHTTWRYFKHAVREVGGEVNQPGIRDGYKR